MLRTKPMPTHSRTGKLDKAPEERGSGTFPVGWVMVPPMSTRARLFLPVPQSLLALGLLLPR